MTEETPSGGEPAQKSFFTRCVEALITEHDRISTGFFHIPHIHKLIGFTCLGHYAYRFYLAFRHGSMFFDPKSVFTWATPALHLTLSLSSFIFPVPVRRFGSKPIIWKELQLHNILFTARSCFIFWLWLYQPCTLKDCTNEHFILRMVLMMGTHYVADLVTDAYQDLGRTTTRDMPWGNDVAEWVPKVTKKYYATCQLFATTALLAQGGQMLDGAFSIMFPIQMSTFLMTLVRKSLITSTQWHLYYGLSLGMIYWLPVAALIRTAQGLPAASYLVSDNIPTPRLISIAHISLAPLAAYLRMRLRLNKYAIIALITGLAMVLSVWERGGSLSAALAAVPGLTTLALSSAADAAAAAPAVDKAIIASAASSGLLQ